MPLGRGKLGEAAVGGGAAIALPGPEEPPVEPPVEPPAGGGEEPVAGETPPTEIGLQLYAAIKPLTYADADNNFDLLHYTDALVQAGQQAYTYGRDSGDIPGWGLLLSADTAPPEALDWLSQFTGARVSDMRRATVIGQLQNLVLNPNFNRSALALAPGRWVTAATNEKFEVTEGWEAGRKALFIKTNTLASGEESKATAEGTASLGGGPLAVAPIVVAEGQKYNAQANVKVTALTGTFGLFVRVKWYDINSNLLSESVTATTAGTVATHLLTGMVTAPALAAAALVEVVAKSEAAGGKLSYFIDEAALLHNETEVAYADGDTSGWGWAGEPGNSYSGKLVLQTEEEFTAAKRAKVREEAAQERGTPQAIVAAAQRFLIGNKTVFVQERDGGAYKLTVITYESQTPDPKQVKAALEEQVPGGIILTYATVKGATYFALRLNYGKYSDVTTAFKTYKGVRNNVLGE